jgi:hypothetical protein
MNVRLPVRSSRAAFTMVEIALALAVIGFALVAIVGVLPQGLTIQKNNREDTLVSQDGPFVLEAIRSGAKGVDALTNSVDQMYVVSFVSGQLQTNEVARDFISQSSSNIIGVLSIPVGTEVDLPRQGARSRISGSLVEAFTIMRPLGGAIVDRSEGSKDLAFRYRIVSRVITSPDTATLNGANPVSLQSISLKFYWPFVDGRVGTRGQQVFRSQFAGVVSSPSLANGATNGVTYFARPLDF